MDFPKYLSPVLTGGLMTYQEFKQRILKTVQQELGTSATVSIQDIIKNNNTHLDGMTIFSAGYNVSPTIYLNYYYKEYEKGRSFSDICQDILKIYRDNRPDSNIDISFFTIYDKVKTRIVFKLINYERNRELLSTVPHFRFLDLAIVFNCLVKTDHTGTATILIQNRHLSFWNITKDDLYALAVSNTPKLLQYDLRNMTDVLKELLCGDSDIPAELCTDSSCPMYMLSNRSKLNGSGCILYQNLLQDFANRLNSDLYILPSSIHEVLIIPADKNSSYDELSNMVREVNATQLSKEEILSDHVYYFSKESGRLTL